MARKAAEEVIPIRRSRRHPNRANEANENTLSNGIGNPRVTEREQPAGTGFPTRGKKGEVDSDQTVGDEAIGANPLDHKQIGDRKKRPITHSRRARRT